MDEKAEVLQKVVELRERKRYRIREPFLPQTGNPENGDYLDYYNSLREGTVVNFPERE